jgi:hypothetical protein|tara:strand:- start:587 stop:1093 length:507 start_codon:yes stop_codon:yes gene_type:complete
MNTKLKARQSELAIEIDALQTEASEKRFEITFDNIKAIKTVQEHLNKGYTWKTQNAAVVVSLYDQFKAQGKDLKSDSDPVVSLRGHELNALYQALLNVEGTGIENARRFITMLTQIGEAVGAAMQELSAVNTSLNDMHAELAEVDAKLDADANIEVVSPELETAKSTK